MRRKIIKTLFDDGRDIIREVRANLSFNGYEIEVFDYLIVDGRFKIEEYSTFLSDVFLDEVTNSKKDTVNGTIDFLSSLTLWITLEEENENVALRLEEIANDIEANKSSFSFNPSRSSVDEDLYKFVNNLVTKAKARDIF